MGNKELFLNKISKGISFTGLGLLVSTLFVYVIKILIARFYSPEEYGQIQIVLSVVYLVSTLSLFGLPAGISRYIPIFRSDSECNKIKILLGSSLIFVISTLTIFSCIIFILSDNISLLFNDKDISSILRIFSLILPFFAINQIFLSVLRGFQRMDYFVYSDTFISRGLRIFLVLVSSLVGLDIYGLSFLYSISFVVACFSAYYFIKKVLFDFNIIKNISIKILNKIIRFSWPLMMSDIVVVARLQIDTLFIGYFLNASNVGIYNTALPISRLLQIGLNSINKIFMPTISEIYNNHDISTIKEIYLQVAKWSFYFTFPLYIVIVIFSKNIISLTFGEKYISGYISLIILSTGVFINAISGSFGETLIAFGKTKIQMSIILFGTLCHIILNILLIPIFKIEGAALANTISIILISILGIFYLYYKYKIIFFSKSHIHYIFISLLVVLSTYPLLKNIIIDLGEYILLIYILIIFIIINILFYITGGYNLYEKKLINKFIKKII